MMTKTLTIVLLACLPMGVRSADPEDPFVGTYVKVSFPSGGREGRLVITKDGEQYRLDDAAGSKKNYYSGFTFTRKKDGQLADRPGGLGTITLGHVKFADDKSPMTVLRVEFCYEHFLLIRGDGGPAPR